ncbi:unnamed protein product [Dovyalis caffra]|uniref:Uncharacterized protein n=1 Tax=Dovyalis caffra TaxID=77055 RepID=A0AAV1RCR9_9ROSI|nr:unnamed protein product [Dovyalis caffra]
MESKIVELGWRTLWSAAVPDELKQEVDCKSGSLHQPTIDKNNDAMCPPVFESMFDQVKLLLMASPLLLLLLVQWFSNDDHQYGRRLSYYLPLPEKDSLHRAGGTPWGYYPSLGEQDSQLSTAS